MRCSATKLFTSSTGPVSSERPMIWSLPAYLVWSLMRSGISAGHGGHQVAQKFSSTTFPRRSEAAMVLPSIVLMVKSGAGAGFLTNLIVSTELSAPEAEEPESEIAVSGPEAEDGEPGESYRWMSRM